MKQIKQGQLQWYYLLAVVLVLLDQLTKYLAVAYLTYQQPLPVLPFFNLTLTYNTGAAFSMFANMGGTQRWFLVAVSLFASVFICWWMTKKRYHFTCLILALILGGAVGNLIDRAYSGSVVDFVSLHAGGYYFAIFNVADSLISIGAALMIIQWLFVERKLPEDQRDW